MAKGKEVIKFDIEVDGSSLSSATKALDKLETAASKSKEEIDELKKQIEVTELVLKTFGDSPELRKSLANQKKSLASVEESYKKLSKGVDAAKASVKALSKAQEKQAAALNDLGGNFDIFNQMRDGLAGAKKGVKSFITALRTVKGAVMATGIGALLIAVTSLVSYFKNTEEGAKTLRIATEALGIIMNKVMDIFVAYGQTLYNVFTKPKETIDQFKTYLWTHIGGVVNSVSDLFSDLGGIIKGVFTLDKTLIEESVESLKENYTKLNKQIADKANSTKEHIVETFNAVVTETKNAIKQAEAYVNAQDNLRKSIAKLVVDNANLNKVLEFQQKIGEDTTKDYETRKEALLKAGEAQLQLSANLAKQAGLEESLLKVQISQTRDIEAKHELQSQLAEAVASRIDAETQLGLVKLDVAQITRELDLEEKERIIAVRDLKLAANEDSTLSAYEAAKNQLKSDEEAALVELEVLKGTEEDKQAIIEGYRKQRLQLDKDEEERIKEDAKAAKAKSDNAAKEHDNKRLDVLAEYNESVKAATDDAVNAKRLQLDNQYTEELKALKKALDDKLITEAEYNSMSKGLAKSKTDKLKELADEETKHKREALKQQVQDAANNAAAVIGHIQKAFEFFEDKANAEVEAKREKADEDAATLKAQLENGDITQEEYDKKAKERAEKFNAETLAQRKKAFEIGKKAKIAEATTTTITSALSAFGSLASIPIVGVPLGLAAAAAATAMGVANIKKIASTQFDGGGAISVPTASSASSSDNSTSTVSAAPVPPSVSGYANASVANNPNNASSAGANQQPTEIRAYVVESDITTTQNNLASYKTRSEIG